MMHATARRLPLLFLLTAAASPDAAAQQAARAEAMIDTLALRAHTYFLSHDLLRGRATGTEGADLAAQYIASQCLRLGLVPAGDSYFQPVALEEARILRASRLVLRRGDRVLEFRAPDDFMPNVGRRATLVDFSGPAVLTGGPAVARLDGVVAVTPGPLPVAAAESLAARGTTALVHLVEEPERYALYVRSRGPTRLYHADTTVVSSFLPPLPSVLAGPRLAAVLLDALPAAPDWRVELRLALERRPVSAANVACLLPGADHLARDTAIAFTAHYDHLGVDVPSAAGDSVYNGFSDNAAGVAMLLAIAQGLAADAEPLAHSALFLFFTGEERGLLGSDHYIAHPLWPLERTAAVINLDAGAPPAPPAAWDLAGVDSTGLGGIAMAEARARGFRVTTSPPRPNSDYYPFIRGGVPAVFPIPAPGPFDGLTTDSSDALRRRWDRYHRPDDEWHPDFPFAGLARYAAFAYAIAREVDRR